MSTGYSEQDLSPAARAMHRALASLQEELEAVDYYTQRLDRSDDAALNAILAHNRDEEIEHAAMLLEYLRRTNPVFDTALKQYLFTSRPVTEIETAGNAETPADLGIGRAAP